MGSKKSKKSKKGGDKTPKEDAAPKNSLDKEALDKLFKRFEQVDECLRDKLELESRRSRDQVRESVKDLTKLLTDFQKDFETLKTDQCELKKEISKVKKVVMCIANQKPRESEPCLVPDYSETELRPGSNTKDTQFPEAAEEQSNANQCLIDAVKKLTGQDITKVIIDYGNHEKCCKNDAAAKIKKVCKKGAFPAHQTKWSTWMNSIEKCPKIPDICPPPRCITCTPLVTRKCCGD